MHRPRPGSADDENQAFDVADAPLEKLKPGIDYGKPTRTAATHEAERGGHDRFPRSDKKEVPQRSLAERVRQAEKEVK